MLRVEELYKGYKPGKVGQASVPPSCQAGQEGIQDQLRLLLPGLALKLGELGCSTRVPCLLPWFSSLTNLPWDVSPWSSARRWKVIHSVLETTFVADLFLKGGTSGMFAFCELSYRQANPTKNPARLTGTEVLASGMTFCF